MSPREARRRALRGLLIMALASSPLIWIKLRLVTGIPRMAYATELAPELTPIELAPAGAMLACEFDLAITEAIVARVE